MNAKKLRNPFFNILGASLWITGYCCVVFGVIFLMFFWAAALASFALVKTESNHTQPTINPKA